MAGAPTGMRLRRRVLDGEYGYVLSTNRTCPEV